jgi:hypothetical protein
LSTFHVLSASAVAFVIARAGVFAWLRRGPKGWVDFVSCPLCVGFWVGLTLGVVRLYLWRSAGDYLDAWRVWPLVVGDALDLVAGGALVGAVALLYACVIDALDGLEQASRGLLASKKLQDTPASDVPRGE